MRDTLGRKPPRHSHISNQVVEKKRVSVQGVWRNERQSNLLTPRQQAQRDHIAANYDMQQLRDKIGLAGIMHITKELIQTRQDKRNEALDALPKPYKVLPTE